MEYVGINPYPNNQSNTWDPIVSLNTMHVNQPQKIIKTVDLSYDNPWVDRTDKSIRHFLNDDNENEWPEIGQLSYRRNYERKDVLHERYATYNDVQFLDMQGTGLTAKKDPIHVLAPPKYMFEDPKTLRKHISKDIISKY
jgi:hypothetical protein